MYAMYFIAKLDQRQTASSDGWVCGAEHRRGRSFGSTQTAGFFNRASYVQKYKQVDSPGLVQYATLKYVEKLLNKNTLVSA